MQNEPRILRSNGKYPAGPNFWARLLTGRRLWESPIDTLTQNAKRFGDIVHYRGLDGHVFQFNHPALIQELLTENEKNNRRVLVMQRRVAFLVMAC